MRFREASKFYFLIALGYSILIGGFLSWIWMNWENKKYKIYGKYLLLFTVIIIFLFNTVPIFTGSIQSLFRERHMPNDYLIAKNFILNQNKYFRTSWMPSQITWSFYTNNNPIITNVPFINPDLWNRFINENTYIDTDAGSSYVKFINQGYMHNLLSLESVKYIFVPTEDEQNDDDIFKYYGESRQFYVKQLDKTSYLHRINIGTKELLVYENENCRPHIYATLQKESIYKDLGAMKYNVNSYAVSSSEYKVNVKEVKAPFYLNFSDAYDNSWKLRVGSFNWFNAIIKKNYFIFDRVHFQNDAGLNSFLIDPQQICKSYSCKINNDGTYDLNLTLYFMPQSNLYLGLIISGSSFAVVLGYLIYVLGKSLYVKKDN